jgi:hypothetical protein
MRLPRVLLPIALLAIAVPGAIAEVCQSSNGCQFWDNSYHEYVLYEEDTTKIDVLIYPSAGPFSLRDMTTAKFAVQGWKDGINAFGATWFKSNMNISAYIVGKDTNIPADALTDPEIIIVMSQHNPVLLFGIGEQLPVSFCSQRDGLAAEGIPHVDPNSYVQQFQCKSGGLTCVALNTNFLLEGTIQMYDLVAHEFGHCLGHCLGPGHVGDALDFNAKTVPAYDVMSYMSKTLQVNCVSNMNVRVMEGIYAPLLGQSSSIFLEPGDYYTMSTSTYQQLNCPNPQVTILG